MVISLLCLCHWCQYTLMLFFFSLSNKKIVYNKIKLWGNSQHYIYTSDYHGEWWSRYGGLDYIGNCYFWKLQVQYPLSWFVVGVQFILYSELYISLQKYEIARYHALSVLDTEESLLFKLIRFCHSEACIPEGSAPYRAMSNYLLKW